MNFRTQRRHFLAMVAALALIAPGTLAAESQGGKPATTTIVVGEMCSGCVKKITARFDKEKKSVAKIKCDIKKKTVTIFPAKDVRLSPLKLWELMEGIGKKPKKLTGPDGTFTSKPKKS